MPGMLDYDFMQRALIAAVLTGLTAPAVGIYLVQRRLALLGDAIGHAALTGVAVGFLTGIAPLYTAVIVAALGAIGIEILRSWGRTNGDVALAMLLYGGIAAGVLLANLSGTGAAQLTSFLFGSITTVSAEDLGIVAILAVVVLIVAIGLRPQLFAVCQDEEHARVSGIPVQMYAIILAVLAAVTVTVAMRTVGLLLVSALMVVPVAAAQQWARSFRTTFIVSMVIGLAAAVGGVVGSYEIDTQPGPTIVLLALAVFAVATITSGARTWVRRRSPPRTMA